MNKNDLLILVDRQREVRRWGVETERSTGIKFDF